MDNNFQKYEVIHNGIKYILSTEIYLDYIRLKCIEANKINPLEYICDFSLSYLRHCSSIFNSTLTIRDAQDLINKTIENQSIEIVRTGSQINVNLFLLNQNQNQNAMFFLNPSTNNQIFSYSSSYIPENFPPIHTTILDDYRKDPNNLSPTKMVIQSKPNISKQINYSNNIPQNSYNNYNPNEINVNENELLNYFPKNSDEIILSNNNNEDDKKKMIQLENESNKIKEENEILKNEKNDLSSLIEQLKNEMKSFNENNNNQLNNNKKISNNENKNNELIEIRQDIERLSKEVNDLKNENENKSVLSLKMREDELSFYKSKMDELLKENYDTKKENKDLKLKMKELINNSNRDKEQYQSLLNSKSSFQSSQKGNLLIVKGELIENDRELELIVSRIYMPNGKIKINLIYKASADSDSAMEFHNKCDSAKSTIVLIKSGNGKRFGGFTSCDWSGNSIFKKDDSAFIFSLDKMKVYDIFPGQDAIGCFPKYGPVFLGCQIRINDNAFTNGGSTFQKGVTYNTEEDYELTDGIKEFTVKEIEVYSINF